MTQATLDFMTEMIASDRVKRAYSRQKEIALTGNGREAYNAAILANHLKMEIGRLEKEGIR